jgi:hypothetical protein
MPTVAQVLKRKRTQYALLNGDGTPAMHCHQDDMEDPIIADDIESLISIAADWADLGMDNFLELMDTDQIEGGPFAIIRERIDVFTLSKKDQAELERLKQEYAVD